MLPLSILLINLVALLSRQFVELTKVRIEGLLAAFPKLMGTGKQHTFIETDSVRYVYQPLESLYILLVTNKNSNILEDLETLHLLAKLVCNSKASTIHPYITSSHTSPHHTSPHITSMSY
jgi:hypothetical protein